MEELFCLAGLVRRHTMTVNQGFRDRMVRSASAFVLMNSSVTIALVDNVDVVATGRGQQLSFHFD